MLLLLRLFSFKRVQARVRRIIKYRIVAIPIQINSKKYIN